MARALGLAERGLFTTQPNPRVGCVLAHGEEVVGEGWHARAGEPHAEVHALRAAGQRARGATAYVTLEPCSHHGRTPPCADALVAAGVARVVACCGDPFPEVAGRGLARLREAGIAVETGLMQEAGRELNRGFFSRLEHGRPWVRVKLASTLDGRTALADGRSQWLTGASARADNMRWRARSSALMAGSGTARHDDPRLTVRLEPGEEFRPPLRVVLDRMLALPPGAQLFDGSVSTLVVHADDVAPVDDRHARCERVAVPAPGGRLDLAAVLEALAGRGVNELQVEAGARVAGSLLSAGLIDELLLYLNPSMLGHQARPLFELIEPHVLDQRPRWRTLDVGPVGEDLRWLLRPAVRPPQAS